VTDEVDTHNFDEFPDGVEAIIPGGMPAEGDKSKDWLWSGYTFKGFGGPGHDRGSSISSRKIRPKAADVVAPIVAAAAAAAEAEAAAAATPPAGDGADDGDAAATPDATSPELAPADGDAAAGAGEPACSPTP